MLRRWCHSMGAKIRATNANTHKKKHTHHDARYCSCSATFRQILVFNTGVNTYSSMASYTSLSCRRKSMFRYAIIVSVEHVCVTLELYSGWNVLTDCITVLNCILRWFKWVLFVFYPQEFSLIFVPTPFTPCELSLLESVISHDTNTRQDKQSEHMILKGPQFVLKTVN